MQRCTSAEEWGLGASTGSEKGGVAAVRPWAVGVQFVPVLSPASGCRERLVLAPSNFQPWGQVTRVKWQSCLPGSQVCSAHGATKQMALAVPFCKRLLFYLDYIPYYFWCSLKSTFQSYCILVGYCVVFSVV